jgi:glyoxylase-like metal-dependent hydrolase (beta-lactamase superfamily II)
MEIVELSPGVCACLNYPETANAGFVVTDKGVVVVDCLDTPARGRQFAKEIGARTDKPPCLVVNTHWHYDHTLGNQAFDAPVIAHCALAGELAEAVARDLAPQEVAAWVEEHPEDRWLVDELEVTYPNIIFEQRLILDLAPALLVVRHLGGHTPDSTIVDLPEAGILFAGDLLFEGRVPFLRYAHFGDLIKALGAIERLGERTIVPGHGALVDRGFVQRTRTYLEDLYGAVAELVRTGWSKEEVVDSDRWPRFWTEDRPELQQANTERLYDELMGELTTAS